MTVRANTLVTLSLLLCVALQAADVPRVAPVEGQPLLAQARRISEVLELLGAPLSPPASARLAQATPETAPDVVQDTLDPLCLAYVHINPESRVKAAQGPAKPELLEQGWRIFLVKVHNEAGVTAVLNGRSPNALPLHNSPKDDLANRWLDAQFFTAQPMKAPLSGLNLEYRVFQLYSRDAGQREARFSFNVGQGTQDLGFRDSLDILFTALPTSTVTFRVKDEHGQNAMAGFTIRDAAQRVYPAQTKRLAPDFSFHPQIYRTEGESVRLPDGAYSVEITRGPEYLKLNQPLTVSKGGANEIAVQLKRWIDPSKEGWWSGDHHIHAAGCAHYEKPTEGVHAPDMFRHIQGEDLKVGCNLTWGPCFDYQKQFFTGKDDAVSRLPYLLRYDIEVSGFGSHQSGHLCLLRLKDQIPPGGDSKAHWPTLGLNTLRWAKKQGAVVGPAHTGWGLEVEGTALPNYTLPGFNSIGANEYIVDVTHEVPGPDGTNVPAVDFLSLVDTPYTWELNIWYHTLNCGFRTRVSGETDFPCIYGERVGLGRSYVKLDGPLNYEAWCEGIRAGRNYVGDGRSHILNFRAGTVAMGENGSELKLAGAGTVKLSASVAALLDAQPQPALQALTPKAKPYWHIERARNGAAREVTVEALVNGQPLARKTIPADGSRNDVVFDVPIERSSWVALRILPSSHTNPIFVVVDGKPIRASRRSAEWCAKGVEQCWSQKQRFIAPGEMEDARKAYDHARRAYALIIKECEVE